MACYNPDDTKTREWMHKHTMEIERTGDAEGISSTHGLSCGVRYPSVVPGSGEFKKIYIFTSHEEILMNK